MNVHVDESPQANDSKSIVYLVESWWGIAWYRCHVPGMALKALGHDVLLTERIDPGWVDACDVLILQCGWQPAALNLVNAVNARGGMTVFDTDDDYWTLHPENPAYGFWTRPRLDGLAAVIRAVQTVTTTTPELAETLKTMNRNVKVLRNMLPDEHWPTERRPTARAGEPLVIGWAGSPGHRPDVRMIASALVQILDEFPHVELQLAGAATDWMPSHPKVKFLEGVPIEKYPGLLSNFDIGLAPLIDNKFNRCKSDLKFLEYSKIGIPSVVSRVAPYASSMRHGESGFLAVNSKDWLKYLRTLVRDHELRERIGAEAHRFAETRLISHTIGAWEKAYRLSG